MYDAGTDIAKRVHVCAVLGEDNSVVIKPFRFTNNEGREVREGRYTSQKYLVAARTYQIGDELKQWLDIEDRQNSDRSQYADHNIERT